MLNLVHRSCVEHPARNAFFIQGRFHTYRAFAERVDAIRRAVEASFGGETTVGILSHDDLDTYAAVFGLWFAGKTMVPLNPANPPERNARIAAQAGLRVVLASRDDGDFSGLGGREGLCFVLTPGLPSGGGCLAPPRPHEPSDLAYILFTSGSTGVPKGVPISHGALGAFLDAFTALGHDLGEGDRFLQMFDLSFDLALMSCCIPLTLGASVYTVPPDGLKSMQVYRLFEEHELTCALLVPSILAHLRPYFPEIHLPKLRASLFCGEALHADLVSEWSACVPGARVQNVYGPTEATIFCLAYDCARDRPHKSLNGVVSLGKPMKSTGILVVDAELRPVPAGEKGELCLSGAQLTPGYWHDPAKSHEAFFTHEGRAWYRTGDLCLVDPDGDVMFLGRLDHQVKIHGYRVELGELEHHAREAAGLAQVAAVTCPDVLGNAAIHLFLEGSSGDTAALVAELRSRLPHYMLPATTTRLDVLPLNANGKIDRPELARRARATVGL